MKVIRAWLPNKTRHSRNLLCALPTPEKRGAEGKQCLLSDKLGSPAPAALSACMAGRGILRGREFERLRWEGGPLRAALVDVLRVHEWAYVRALQQVLPGFTACRHHLQGRACAVD